MASAARVTFLPAGISVAATPGASLFELAREAGLAIETACVGQATCGLCRVKIVKGGEHLSAFDDAERKHLGNVYFINRLRLSCRARPTGAGDVVLEVPPPRSH
jgi:uncharacterized 2Fe-2S/4Fe-4S cluster protein (DUF4445 family)